MTFTTRDESGLAGARAHGGLSGRSFVLLLAATLCAFSNYAPMLSVVPLWSAEGGARGAGVGAATGVTMGATVAVQLGMPWLLARCGARAASAWGAVLLGVPTLAYLASSGLAWVLTVSAVRGAGFGVVAVAGSALVAELVTEDERARAVSRYGVAVGLPQVLCLPAAVWSVERFGYAPVFVVTALLSVAAAPVILAVRTAPGDGAPPAPAHGPVPGPGRDGRWRPLAVPWTVLVTAACALGGVTSFLPLALTEEGVAATALFVLSSTVVAGRWVAGRLSDRLGPGRVQVPSILACAAGVGGFAAAVAGVSPWLVSTAGAAVYGIGFGALQNDTLVVMFDRASGPGGSAWASAAWNMAYDAGTGVGAVAVGLLSGVLTVSGAFAVTATAVLLSAAPAWGCRRRPGQPAAGRAAVT